MIFLNADTIIKVIYLIYKRYQIHCNNFQSTDVSITGMLNLVDLAGSERLKKSESQGVRLKEALHINTSLSALGKVIMSLDPSAESTHIPYRDAKLTRILQNSLGGNSYTVVLAAIHPSPAYYDECLSTLQFANRCRNVRNNPRVNYIDDPADKDSRIKRLQEEIVVLRTKISQNEKNPLSGGKGGGGMSAAKLVEALKKLGVSASLAADGAMIVNGERHELEDLGLEEEQEDEGSDEEGLSASQPGVKMSRKKLKRVYLELQDANRVHSLKSKERKVLMQEQGKQIQVLSMQVSRLALAVRRNDSEMMLQKDSISLRALEEAKLINESHRREMDKLIEHHETANKRQMNVIQNAPNTFKTYTELVKQQGQLKDSYEEPLRKDFDVYMTKLSAAHEHEIGAQKKQYDFFLSEKDKSLIDFTEKFNAFRTKKTEQLRMCEQEIIKLFEYIEQIDLILDNVEKGVYKVEQKQGRFGKTILGTTGAIRKDSIPDHAGLLFSIAGNSVASAEYDDNVVNNGVKGRVLLPRGLRPYNPIREGGSNEMKLSQKIIANYNLRKGKFEQAQKYLDKKTATFTKNTLSTAAANRPESEGVDPLVEQHLRELLGPAGITANLFGTRTGTAKSGKRGAPLRPASAPATAIPKSLALASTHDKFHIVNKVSANSSEVDADRLGMKEPSSLRERRGMDSILSLHRTYSTSSVRDPSFILNPPNPGTRSPVSTSPLAHSSDGRIANWNVERKQNIFDRKNGIPVDRPGTGSSRGYDSSGFGFSNAGERDVASSDEVALLRAELLELKAQMKIDQVCCLNCNLAAYFL
jgi:predicted TIM-barrel fold metal-dependent hydrolase